MYPQKNETEGILNEYLLMISPDKTTSLEILKIKQAFKDNYNCNSAPHSKPHLTLIRFACYRNTEALIIRHFESAARSFAPGSIALHDFGQFPAHTIYVKVQDGGCLLKMVKAIRSKSKLVLKSVKDFKPFYVSEPHMTIARGMSEQQFDQAWPEWGKRKFRSVFVADRMLLLKRPLHADNMTPADRYSIVKYFDFTGTEGQEEQLSLF